MATRLPDDAHMAPGQVYTIEPELYTDECGYRHSDTVAITESGPGGSRTSRTISTRT